jgi:cellulose synthase/poly-beta-1,6-N-acetylglucosamine synthase-like glycosyltransferase
VDDASSDGRWERILARLPERPRGLRIERIDKNGHKVLAIKRAVELSEADYVFLTDFDSRIENPEEIDRILDRLERNPSLAGACLKLVPEGSSTLSKFQDIEYAIGRRIFGTYLSTQKNMRCIPGAAGCGAADSSWRSLTSTAGGTTGTTWSRPR